MKRKKLVSVCMASAMVLGLTACGGSGGGTDSTTAGTSKETKAETAAGSETAAGDETKAAEDTAASGDAQTITFTFRDDGQGEKSALWQWIQDGYDSWDKKDSVKLNISPIVASEGDYFAKIALQLQDPSTCPDLVCEDTFQLPNDVSAGYLTDLTDYVKDYPEWNDGTYYESMQNGVSKDGKPYGIPYCTDTRGLWYNKDIFKQAGLPEEWAPKSWQDILDACKTIKEKVPDVVPFWCNSGVATGEATSMQTYEMLLYGTGERLIDDNGKWIVKSQGMLDSLNFLNDIYSNGYGPSLSKVLNGQASNTSAREYLPQGKLAISLDGSWIPGNWEETGASPWPEAKDVLGFAPMPTSTGQEPGTITLAGGWALSIPENSDAKDITFEFIKHLMDPSIYTKAVIAQGNIATRTDVAKDADYAAKPFKQISTDFLATAEFRPQNDQYSTVSTSIQSMVEAVVSGTSPEDAIAQYGTEVKRAVGDDETVTK